MRQVTITDTIISRGGAHSLFYKNYEVEPSKFVHDDGNLLKFLTDTGDVELFMSKSITMFGMSHQRRFSR